MTYILDMAGGTEYQGDELSCSHPLDARKLETPSGHENFQVELRLAEVEPTPPTSSASVPGFVDLAALIGSLED
jgi:hypothetical protein